MVDLIKKNRLFYLENGSRFPKYDSKAGRLKSKPQDSLQISSSGKNQLEL